MPMVSLRLALLSFCSFGLIASTAVAQEAPPVADPAPGQPPVVAPSDPVPAPGITVTLPETAAPEVPAVDPIPAVWAPAPRDAEGHTAYGLYLGGRYLTGRSAQGEIEGDGARGARILAQVQALTPEQPLVREQAFTAALLAGDLDDAARIAPSGPGVQPVIGEAGRLVTAVQAFAHGDPATATALLKERPIRAPHARAAILVRPWIAAAAGDWDFALIEATSGATDMFSQVLRFQRAQLLEIHRRDDEAEAEYKALSASPLAQPPFRLGYGGFLERRGRRDEAIALYDLALNDGGATDPQTRAARDRAASRGRPPQLSTLREGAAGALVLAAALASNDGAQEFAAVYVRLALNVEPDAETRLLLGGVLARAKLESAARDALAQVPLDDPRAYAAARLQIGASLGRQDRNEDALVEFRRAVEAAPTDAGAAYALAAQLIQLKRNEEALEILNGPVLNTAGQGSEIHFMRGAAYEDLGRIPEAEAELWAALQDQPDQPAFLNYLGYLWVDTGTRVAEGSAMIARAHAAEPNDGNIQDSLGWAQYRQGQYDTAVATLEEAVAKEPANAEINDHLGDAYWQIGRRREAGFQWSRVLTLEPDAERRAGVERKLADGLTPPEPVSDGR